MNNTAFRIRYKSPLYKRRSQNVIRAWRLALVGTRGCGPRINGGQAVGPRINGGQAAGPHINGGQAVGPHINGGLQGSSKLAVWREFMFWQYE